MNNNIFHIKSVILLLAVMLTASCSLYEEKALDSRPQPVTREYKDTKRTITITEIPDLTDGKILGKKLPNPYSYEVMSKAWEELHPRTKSDPDTTAPSFEPNYKYVRMLPETSSDVDWILDSDYEYFNYPLDYEILGNPDEYQDPSLTDTTLTWLYTVIPIDAQLPSMDYDVLEVCYIPEGPSSNPNGGLTPIEQLAFGMVGYEINGNPDDGWNGPEIGPGFDDPGGNGGNPGNNILQGNIKYYDGALADSVGVKGVKVTLRHSLKIRTVYTDEYGHYEMTNVFGSTPTRKLSFNNVEGFSCRYITQRKDIWKNKTFDIDSWSIDTNPESQSWALANINNAAYDWYKYCESTGIQKPANNLRIMAIEPASGASTLMLAHGMMYHLNIPQILHISFRSYYDQFIYSTFYGIVCFVLQLLGPDVVVCGIDNCSSSMIYEYISHELSHASHFQQLGSTNSARCDWWSDVFSYELTNIIESGGEDTYGSASDPGNGPCGVTEMWAHAVGDFFLNMKYGLSRDTVYWFKNKALEHLFLSGLITPKNAYDQLQPGVTDISIFKNQLQYAFPELSFSIDTAFSNPNNY